MARCVVFCAGGFQGLEKPLLPDDYIIAADGGFSHVQTLGCKPDCILGDFDSLGFVPEGAQVFPVEKDDTDAMLAVRHGLALGYREFVFYGALEGARLDHTISNYQTLLYLVRHGAHGTLVGCHQCVTTVTDSLSFPEGMDGTVSVFAVGGEARGVTLTGLQYNAEDITLTPDFPLGVSNHFTGSAAIVSVNSGTLLVVYPR
ncbi:MAG: thiamine diphosphokinase [Oscillospiraceae bacterium]|nr:thiamine diphosphokinase [Oscillospiraceae bacterium]